MYLSTKETNIIGVGILTCGLAICGNVNAAQRLFYENFDDQVNNFDHCGSTNGASGCEGPPHSLQPINYNGGAGYSWRIAYGAPTEGGLYDLWQDVPETTTGEHYLSYWYRIDETYGFNGVGWTHKNIRFWRGDDGNMNDVMMEVHLIGMADGSLGWDICPQVNGVCTYGSRPGISNTPPRDTNWHHVEVHIIYDNPVGSGNGRIRVWFDGVIGFDRSNSNINKAGYPFYTRFSVPSNKSSSSYPDNYYVDEVEIWDGMPLSTPQNLRTVE